MKNIFKRSVLGISVSAILLSCGISNQSTLAEQEPNISLEKAKEEISKELKAQKTAFGIQVVKDYQEKLRLRREEEKKKQAHSNSILFELTFYTSLPEENGGYGLMANGQSVETAQNVVASNFYKLGTKINLEGFGIVTVSDRGGSSFNKSTRLDVLVPRKPGESKTEYRQRVLAMGRRKVYGTILK